MQYTYYDIFLTQNPWNFHHTEMLTENLKTMLYLYSNVNKLPWIYLFKSQILDIKQSTHVVSFALLN